MSFTSRLVLTSSCIGTVGVIVYVHYRQKFDRDNLHLGVVREYERQEKRKIENLYILEQQNELAKKLKTKQSMEPTGGG